MGTICRTNVIALAKKYADEGYTEGPNNWTIFAKVLDDCDYYAPQKKQNVAWCHTFVNFLFLMSSDSEDESAKKYDAYSYLAQPDYNNLSCGCTFGAGYFRSVGAFYDIQDAYIGDIIYFGERGNESHVGLIIDLDYDDHEHIKTVYTVEGNKADAVRYGEYSVHSSYISGVGKPVHFDYYDDLDKPQPEPPKPTPVPYEPVTIILDVLSKGSTGGQVNTLKALLNEFGFCDRLPLDGDFDWDTEQAVNLYKENYGLEANGIVDAAVWELLLK